MVQPETNMVMPMAYRIVKGLRRKSLNILQFYSFTQRGYNPLIFLCSLIHDLVLSGNQDFGEDQNSCFKLRTPKNLIYNLSQS